MPLESIRSLIQPDLLATDNYLGSELLSDIPLINELTNYILSCGGKRIRPVIVILAAHAFNHQGQQHINLATAMELIHTATLLHDDVVDNSTLRRGRKTANNIWGNEASVLVGDFLYSRAFQLIVKLDHQLILGIFADATNLIAEGEVLQLINCHNPDTSEQSYYHVIERKTAKLFEVAARIGTALSSHTETQMNAMQKYGSHVGIAYQLIDDALDYRSSTAETGKNIGNDLAEGKPTLPLIYALQNATKAQAKLLRKSIETGSTKNLASILEIIESTQAIEYTAHAAKEHALTAIASLAHIPQSPYRSAMAELCSFIVERKY
jgi:octaprenyl-diphosphate synthase